ncbi:hypothetical protein FHS92_002535 [Sphingobium subterraneum]|uniref:Uncharacterized protein n=1 Tax=Sphingobium subterraneum TaxID=627688 RepID=A0A841J362_9SPHN|nr:hypothetical protein [Sphingobium subterraneum]
MASTSGDHEQHAVVFFWSTARELVGFRVLHYGYRRKMNKFLL